MNLPDPTTRKFRILKAFIGKQLSTDDLVATSGMFGLETRSSLLTELRWLCNNGYLIGDTTGFSLTDSASKALESMGVSRAEVVQPRTFTWKPLDTSRLHQKSLRRKSTLDRENTRQFIVGPSK